MIGPVLVVAAALSVQSPFSRVIMGQSDISVCSRHAYNYIAPPLPSHCHVIGVCCYRLLGDPWSLNMGTHLLYLMHMMNGSRY